MPASRRSQQLLMVGLGASAGGLTPLRNFFEAVPADCGIAFVVISHSNPERPSLLRSRRVDVFLTSMAREMRTRCAGVVLSGCGGDGSAGIEAVAAHGGLTLVQAPATAEESGMPCAIATGQVQQVVAVEQMPALIAQHFRMLRPQHSTRRSEAS